MDQLKNGPGDQDDLAPVILFIYNRPGHTRQTLTALSANDLAALSTLYVFADGPKAGATAAELDVIAQTRSVVEERQWCKEVVLISREHNLELEDNVIDGVTQVVRRHGKVIVLEDDIITSPYFLRYCNQALKLYEGAKQVFSINGFMFPISFDGPAGTFLSPVAASSWGWATWADRWELFEHSPQFINEIVNDAFLQARFNIGIDNKTVMLKYMNTWDIRWYYTAFVRNGLGLFPTRSLVKNIGFDGSGTHKGNENLQQDLYPGEVPVIYNDTIHLGHYSRTLNYLKEPPLGLRQRIKQSIKLLLDL